MAEERCGVCRFYLSEKLSVGKQGACRRRPPMPFLVPGPAGMGMQSLFPMVDAKGWCGDFEERELLDG